jgi:hypothetical protein
MALPRTEQAVWLRFLAAEVRRDEVGRTAQIRLAQLLDYGQAKGGMCTHADCVEQRDREMDKLSEYIWQKPVQ